jgi:hypothetical protein
VARLAIPILALALGAALAVGLVSCGGRDEKGLLPGNNAKQILDNLASVEQDAANGDCAGATAGTDEIRSEIDQLGASVNSQLRQRLSDGVDRLDQAISNSCQEATASIPTVQTPTSTGTESTTTKQKTKSTTNSTTQTAPTTPSTTPSTPTTPTGPPTGGTGSPGGTPVPPGGP